jgi:hypothetical protein
MDDIAEPTKGGDGAVHTKVIVCLTEGAAEVKVPMQDYAGSGPLSEMPVEP